MKEQLRCLLEQVKKESFVEGYDASDEEAMGILVSKYVGFCGIACLKVAYSALENSNFHPEKLVIAEMIETLQALANIQQHFKKAGYNEVYVSII